MIYVPEHHYDLQNLYWGLHVRLRKYEFCEDKPETRSAIQSIKDEMARLQVLILEEEAKELTSRVYITSEQFRAYLDRPNVRDAVFDESKMGDKEAWCHICGEFSYNRENKRVWYKWEKGDGERPLNVCPHCGGLNTMQDVGP